MFNCIRGEKKKGTMTGHMNVKEVFQKLVTCEDVMILVENSISSDAELLDFRLQPFSQDKLGYLGSHFCLIVTVKKSEDSENVLKKFFVKTLPYEVPSQAAFVEEKGCIQKETKFFELVEPLMTDNIKGERWVPKCYSSKPNAMIFDDLKPEGFTNRARLLDENSVEAAFGCIARMHASSLIAEERIQGKSLRNLYPDIFRESEFRRDGRCYTTVTVGINLTIDLAKEMGLDSSNIRQASERVFGVAKPSKNKRNVVSHGDLWSSNVIFNDDDHCRLVDFQMVRYLPPGHDLMLLLYYGASTEVRQSEKRLVEHYYQVFTETLKLNDFKGEVISFEELLQGIEELRLPALITAVLFHPIILMDSSTASKIMNNPVTCQAIFIGDRKSMVKDYMNKNQEYRKKIQDNIREFVELTLRLDSIPEFI